PSSLIGLLELELRGSKGEQSFRVMRIRLDRRQQVRKGRLKLRLPYQGQPQPVSSVAVGIAQLDSGLKLPGGVSQVIGVKVELAEGEMGINARRTNLCRLKPGLSCLLRLSESHPDDAQNVVSPGRLRIPLKGLLAPGESFIQAVSR